MNGLAIGVLGGFQMLCGSNGARMTGPLIGLELSALGFAAGASGEPDATRTGAGAVGDGTKLGVAGTAAG